MKVLHRIAIVAIVSIAALSITSCSKSRFDQASGKATVKAIHAATGLSQAGFLIEERTLTSLNYKEALAGARYDNLTYNFNFDLISPINGSVTRIASRSVALETGTDYTLVLTGTADNANILVWERPEKTWQGDESVFSVGFGHVASSWGDMDVYFAPTGTAPTLGNQVATLSFGERAAELELTADEYELILTAAGDPSTVYFRTSALSMAAARNVLFSVFDNNGSTTADLNVRIITGGSSQELIEANSPPELRVVHSALGVGNLDAYLDGDFTTAIATDVAFSQFSPYVATIIGSRELSLTPSFDTAVITAQATLGIGGSSWYSAYVFGTAAEPAIVTFLDRRRFIDDYAKLRIVQGSENHATLDIYVEAPGTDLTAESPYLAGLPSRTGSLEIFLEPAAYEMTVTVAGEKTVIAGPFSIDLLARDVREILIVDTVDPATADFVVVTDLSH